MAVQLRSKLLDAQTLDLGRSRDLFWHLFTCLQGWANYKFFLLFLWYSGALGMFVASTTIYELINFVDSGPNVSWGPVRILRRCTDE